MSSCEADKALLCAVICELLGWERASDWGPLTEGMSFQIAPIIFQYIIFIPPNSLENPPLFLTAPPGAQFSLHAPLDDRSRSLFGASGFNSQQGETTIKRSLQLIKIPIISQQWDRLGLLILLFIEL